MHSRGGRTVKLLVGGSGKARRAWNDGSSKNKKPFLFYRKSHV